MKGLWYSCIFIILLSIVLYACKPAAISSTTTTENSIDSTKVVVIDTMATMLKIGDSLLDVHPDRAMQVYGLIYAQDPTYQQIEKRLSKAYLAAPSKKKASIKQISPALDISLSTDEKLILAIHQDTSASVWGLSGTKIVEFTGHRFPIKGGKIQQQSALFITFDVKGNILLWDQEGKLHTTLKSGNDPILDIAISPNNQMVISSSSNGLMRIWHLKEEMIYSVQSEYPVTQLSFSPDGTWFMGLQSGGNLIRWDIEGKLINTFEPPHGISPKDFVISSAPPYTIIANDNNRQVSWGIDGQFQGIHQAYNAQILEYQRILQKDNYWKQHDIVDFIGEDNVQKVLFTADLKHSISLTKSGEIKVILLPLGIHHWLQTGLPPLTQLEKKDLGIP